MANARILQWPHQEPLHTSPVERAIETAHKIADAGQLLLVCTIQNEECKSVWLEKFKGNQFPYHYPNQPTSGEVVRWVIKVYPTHPMYEQLSANQPIAFVEFLFTEEPYGGWYATEPSSYLIVKDVR